MRYALRIERNATSNNETETWKPLNFGLSMALKHHVIYHVQSIQTKGSNEYSYFSKFAKAMQRGTIHLCIEKTPPQLSSTTDWTLNRGHIPSRDPSWTLVSPFIRLEEISKRLRVFQFMGLNIDMQAFTILVARQITDIDHLSTPSISQRCGAVPHAKSITKTMTKWKKTIRQKE